ncbi:MAG: hypothetical protein GY710_04250 [Desulfobacteraceae bacterium]|nr:hypothetical protein [Desulfobacteraceae bacterium]
MKKIKILLVIIFISHPIGILGSSIDGKNEFEFNKYFIAQNIDHKSNFEKSAPGDISAAKNHKLNNIIPIDVKSVVKKNIEITPTKKKYDYSTSEYHYRLKNVKVLQNARWLWVQNHPEDYVNLLRKAGITDKAISAMSERKYPLGFSNQDQYDTYVMELINVMQTIEKKYNIHKIRVVQQGSYITGYSSNPRKGSRKLPDHIFHKESDLDFRMSGVGIGIYIKTLKKKPKAWDDAPNLLYPDSVGEVFPEVQFFLEKWASIIGRQIQATIDTDPGPEFEPNPWDWEIQIPVSPNNINCCKRRDDPRKLKS